MPKPPLMTHAEWIRRTNVQKYFNRGIVTRSAQGLSALTNVDLYLHLYHQDAENGQWPEKLRNLELSLDTWIRSKTKNDGTLKTQRDHIAVRELERQVKAARRYSEPAIWKVDFPGIWIANDNFTGIFPVPGTFAAGVRASLGKLIEKPAGLKLLQMLSQKCVEKNHRVVVQYTKGGGSIQCAPVGMEITGDVRRRICEFGEDRLDYNQLTANPALARLGVLRVKEQPEFVENGGANAIIKFWPDDEGEPKGRPVEIGLAHEFVHAYHFVCGICARIPTGGTSGNSGGAEEEMFTIGTRTYAGIAPSENQIRKEWDQPERTSYSGNHFESFPERPSW